MRPSTLSSSTTPYSADKADDPSRKRSAASPPTSPRRPRKSIRQQILRKHLAPFIAVVLPRTEEENDRRSALPTSNMPGYRAAAGKPYRLYALVVTALLCVLYYKGEIRSRYGADSTTMDLLQRARGGLGLPVVQDSSKGGRTLNPRAIRLPDGFRVAIYEANPYHLEVMGSVLYDLTEMGVVPDVYRDGPVLYGFEEITNPFYSKPHVDTTANIDSLLTSLEKGTDYDLLVLTTCENSYQRLLPALNKNPHTRVACMLHHGIREPEFKDLYNLTVAGTLTVMGLNEQCTRFAKVEINRLAEETGEVRFDRIRAVTLTPTYPLLNLKIDDGPRTRRPAKIAVQGTIDTEKRRYNDFLQKMFEVVQADPSLWELTLDAEGHWVPAEGAVDPLEIHLMGQSVKWSKPIVPKELEKVLTQHSGVHFRGYYEMMNKMDLLVPLLGIDGYYRDTASSSMGAGLITRTPVLANARHALAYTYLEPPAAIFHPVSMSEADAIRQLRLGEDPMSVAPQHEYTARFSSPSFVPMTWPELQDKFHHQNRLAWQVIAGLDLDRGVNYPL